MIGKCHLSPNPYLRRPCGQPGRPEAREPDERVACASPWVAAVRSHAGASGV